MGVTSTYSFPYPGLIDAPNGPSQVQALAEALDTEVARVDADIAALLPASVVDTQNTIGTTTATTHSATLTGGTACGVAFTAPASGKINITNTCEAFNSGSGFANCSYEIRTGASIGSGTIVTAVSFDHATQNTGTSPVRASVTQPWTGLTPSLSYNVRQMFRVNSGTGTFLRKQLAVAPLLT